MSQYHTPVLLKESIDALVQNTSGLYIDATFGGGGHTAEILSRLTPGGKVIAFDRDIDALAQAGSDPRLKLVHGDFRFVRNFARLHAGADAAVDGILADLGVSSHQFDTAERGFSFRFDAPLDMRMNTEGGITAADVVNDYDARKLEAIFRTYGEVDNARKVAQLIESARKAGRIETTGKLSEAIAKALPAYAEHKYLAKVYQALRIEVNHEMRSLEKFLQGTVQTLKKGGRLVVITYHSLEDRMVKNFIRSGNIEGTVEKDIYGKTDTPFEAVNRKPVLPAEEEIAANTRARSAKLRIAERI